MASILLLGSKTKAFEYLDLYIGEHKIPGYNIEKLNGAKIEDVRGIKKKLSFKNFGDRLFFIYGEITTEAQNALLKSVEEHASTTHFIFAAEKEDQLLPTIRSRCFVVRLEKEVTKSEEIKGLISLYFSKSANDWDILDKIINEIGDTDPEMLIVVTRNVLIDDLEVERNTSRIYASCKKMLFLLPLVSKNNLSVRTFVEKAFLPDTIS